jgi:hypothetical protein
VFSNAVIEHIDKHKRDLFANEIRRVCKKGYFITTPNFFFPFEPHYLCPFFQYLPEIFKKTLKKYITLGHFRKGCYEKIDLLTKKELQKLFPEAKIIGLKISNSLIAETLVCYKTFV